MLGHLFALATHAIICSVLANVNLFLLAYHLVLLRKDERIFGNPTKVLKPH